MKFLSFFSSLIVVFSVFAPSLTSQIPQAQAEYTDVFSITGYYSACEGQSFYAQGNYQAELIMNGQGIAGASGVPVHFGMVAAPSIFPFGTKLKIPAVAEYLGMPDLIFTIEDRGGAIVDKDSSGTGNHRLDIWMGYCEEALIDALEWGFRDVEVIVYLPGDPIDGIEVGPSGPPAPNSSSASSPHPTVSTSSSAGLFTQTLSYSHEGDEVQQLQLYLTELGYYSGPITAYYDEATQGAVFAFQQDLGIVSSWDDYGAGFTGPQTATALKNSLEDFRSEASALVDSEYQTAQAVLSANPDLSKNSNLFTSNLSEGDQGDEVYQLQEELVNLGYLRIEPTGYFGPLTTHALSKLQQKWNIVESLDDPGAGILGIETRTRLNQLISDRNDEMIAIATNREEILIPDSQNGISSNFISAAPIERTMSFGDRGIDVKQLQLALHQLGYFALDYVTEFYGPATEAAVMAFQLDSGLISSSQDSQAGILDQGTLDALNRFILPGN